MGLCTSERGAVTATNVLADVSSRYALRLPGGVHLPADSFDPQDARRLLGHYAASATGLGSIPSRHTEIPPSRGFPAEFATACTVLLASRLGLPAVSIPRDELMVPGYFGFLANIVTQSYPASSLITRRTLGCSFTMPRAYDPGPAGKGHRCRQLASGCPWRGCFTWGSGLEREYRRADNAPSPTIGVKQGRPWPRPLELTARGRRRGRRG